MKPTGREVGFDRARTPLILHPDRASLDSRFGTFLGDDTVNKKPSSTERREASLERWGESGLSVLRFVVDEGDQWLIADRVSLPELSEQFWPPPITVNNPARESILEPEAAQSEGQAPRGWSSIASSPDREQDLHGDRECGQACLRGKCDRRAGLEAPIPSTLAKGRVLDGRRRGPGSGSTA